MEQLCFIGNSHVGQLYNFNELYVQGKVNSNYIALYKLGASIKGLTNTNSKLKLRETLEEFQYYNPSYKLIFFLGQVDIEFGYYYKCIKDNIKYDINNFINNLITLYEQYLLTLKCDIHILSINPCVLTDNERLFNICFKDGNGEQGYYSENNNSINYNDYKYLIDDYSTRYNNNILFNIRLKEMCIKNKFNYIDFWHIVTNNNQIKDDYFPKNIDHHLLHPNDDIFNYIRLNITSK